MLGHLFYDTNYRFLYETLETPVKLRLDNENMLVYTLK